MFYIEVVLIWWLCNWRWWLWWWWCRFGECSSGGCVGKVGDDDGIGRGGL